MKSREPSIDELLLSADDSERTDLDKVIEQFLKPENLKQFTDLTGEEVLAIAKLHADCVEFDLKWLRIVLAEFLTMRISKGRRGRREFIDIVGKQMHAMDRGGRWDRVFGDRRDRY